MSKKEKLRARFFKRPTANDISFAEAQTILTQYGFIKRTKSSGTSHCVFTHPKLSWALVVATVSGRSLKEAYIEKICDAIVEVEEND